MARERERDSKRKREREKKKRERFEKRTRFISLANAGQTAVPCKRQNVKLKLQCNESDLTG